MNAAAVSRFSSAFDQDMFMKLLITQLKHQNPEEPMSNAELTAQISSLAMVEGMNKLNASFGDILKLQRLLSGAQIIGRQVEYFDGAQMLSGQVQAVNTNADTVKVTVDGREVPLEDVMRIL